MVPLLAEFAVWAIVGNAAKQATSAQQVLDAWVSSLMSFIVAGLVPPRGLDDRVWLGLAQVRSRTRPTGRGPSPYLQREDDGGGIRSNRYGSERVPQLKSTDVLVRSTRGKSHDA